MAHSFTPPTSWCALNNPPQFWSLPGKPAMSHGSWRSLLLPRRPTGSLQCSSVLWQGHHNRTIFVFVRPTVYRVFSSMSVTKKTWSECNISGSTPLGWNLYLLYFSHVDIIFFVICNFRKKSHINLCVVWPVLWSASLLLLLTLDLLVRRGLWLGQLGNF